MDYRETLIEEWDKCADALEAVPSSETTFHVRKLRSGKYLIVETEIKRYVVDDCPVFRVAS